MIQPFHFWICIRRSDDTSVRRHGQPRAHCSIVCNRLEKAQPKCPSMGEWIGETYLEYYSATRKKEILPFVPTLMDFQGITLSEVGQRKANRI